MGMTSTPTPPAGSNSPRQTFRQFRRRRRRPPGSPTLDRPKIPPIRFHHLGKTPLHYAAENEHLEVVKLLLQHGASCSMPMMKIDDPQYPPPATSPPPASAATARRSTPSGHPTIPGWMQLTALHRAQNRKDAQLPRRSCSRAAADRQWVSQSSAASNDPMLLCYNSLEEVFYDDQSTFLMASPDHHINLFMSQLEEELTLQLEDSLPLRLSSALNRNSSPFSGKWTKTPSTPATS